MNIHCVWQSLACQKSVSTDILARKGNKREKQTDLYSSLVWPVLWSGFISNPPDKALSIYKETMTTWLSPSFYLS